MDTPASRIQYPYTNVDESPYTVCYGASSASQPTSSPYHHHHHSHHHQASHPVGSPTFSARSESMASISSSRGSEHGSSSSCTSYASNRTVNHHILNLEYDLPCEFGFAGCRVRFRAVDDRDWISHSISHFGARPLPSRAICTFCDVVFKAEARNDQSLDMNWRERMKHIATHFAALESESMLRPDFGVIEHMWRNGLLSNEDWETVKIYTERPHGCPDIVSRRQPDIREEEEESRRSGVCHNSRDEKREMKRRSANHRGSHRHRENR